MIKINKVKVYLFRNLKAQFFNLEGKNVAFKGNNAIGKTNLLNAISWCLTGADLEQKAKDNDNVPYNSKREDGKIVVDVAVETSNGTIRRTITMVDGSCKENIYINDVPAKTIKEGETQIDKVLGILPLTIGLSKDFNLRKFLINPLYVSQVKESALREWIISLIINKVDYEGVYRQLPELVQTELYDLVQQHNYNVSSISAIFDSKLKETKKEIAYWENVIDYLNKWLNSDEKALQQATDFYTEFKKWQTAWKQKQASLDLYANALSKELDDLCKTYFGGLVIKLFEKGVGEDVWKNVCYPLVPENNLKLSLGSTSERIILGSQMVCSVARKLLNIDPLFILFDECETLDNNSLKKLAERTDTQFITAKVENGSDKVEMEIL